MSSDDDSRPETTPPLADLAGDVLNESRPTPARDFQLALAERLTGMDPGWGPRPQKLWPQALVFIAVGVLLLIVGALLSAGGT